MRQHRLAVLCVAALPLAWPAGVLVSQTPKKPTASTASSVACKAKTDKHERWEVKTRTPPTSPSAKPIDVGDLIDNYEIPQKSLYKNLKKGLKGYPDETIPGTAEETVFELTGYVVLAKLAPDDCDIHMEVAESPSMTARRVIVEVPPTLAAEQQQVLTLLGVDRLGTKTNPFPLAQIEKNHFTFEGYGFFDLSHHAAGGAKEGQSHGSYHIVTKAGKKVRIWNVKTILELHPVFSMIKGQ